MKISDFKDEAALTLVADIIEPMAEIFQDGEVKKYLSGGKATMLKAVKPMIAKHTPAVMEILAAMDGVPVESFHCGVMTLPVRILEILADPELQNLFLSQAQATKVSVVSGSATVSTGENEI